MLLTFIILGVTIILFVWGKIPAEIVAILSLLTLYLTGIINTSQALAGFANSTVVMIAALFVVGAGLSETGVTAWLGQQMLKLAGSSNNRLLGVTMGATGGLSGFVSNTGTVATLLPAVVAAAWSIGSVPSKFLMPLAVSANAGGLLTLIGTPPNIVVADTLTEAGLPPFGFFEFGLVGLPLLLCTIAYVVFIGQRSLPERGAGERPVDLAASLGELTRSYGLTENLFRLRVRNGSDLAEKTLAQSSLGRDYGVSVIKIERNRRLLPGRLQQPVQDRLEEMKLWGEEELLPGPDTLIHINDILTVRGEDELVERLMARFKLALQLVEGDDQETPGPLLSREVGVAEILLTPRSEYIGQTIAEGQFWEKFGVRVLSLQRHGKPVDLRSTQLNFGDSLLGQGTWEAINRLKNEHRNFVVVGSPDAMARQVVELNMQAIIAIVALLTMVILMLTESVPTVMASIIAALMMILGRCLTVESAYRAINWGSVILIAAMIPMSTALEITGGAEFLANGLVSTLGAMGPIILMTGVFLLTTAFSQVISNTATTVLMAPIVLQAASSVGVSPYPMLMMVAVAASAAFLTPIASPPNTMVMSAGGYNFNDYVKSGFPLVVIFLVVSLLLVPLIWPLHP